jgi:FixJ family two-component response regulator
MPCRRRDRPETALADLGSKAIAPIDMLVTDVRLSGMDGPQFAQRVTRGRRDMPVLFMSGCSETMVPPLPPGAAFVEKPFTAQTLLGCVRELLDARPGQPQQLT